MRNIKLIALGTAGLGLVAAGYGLAPAPSETAQPVAAANYTPPVREWVIPAGTTLHVRLNETLGTAISRAGQRFNATLTEPLLAGGRTVVPRGAQVRGIVREAVPSRRLKGQAVLMLALESVNVDGHAVPLHTTSHTSRSGGHTKRNSWLIGGGAGGGALIGALAGGGAGAAIGAGSGAVAGLTGALVTGRKQIRLPAETVVGFRLVRPVLVRG